MIAKEFEYVAPGSLEEALQALQQGGDDAKVLAGGHSLLPMMKLRFATPAHLVDLARIPDLRGIAEVGHEIAWEGQGANEVGRDSKTGRTLIRIDPHYFRPTEVDVLLGDPSKALAKLGWKHTTSFPELVSEMVTADLELVKQERWRNDRSA